MLNEVMKLTKGEFEMDENTHALNKHLESEEKLAEEVEEFLKSIDPELCEIKDKIDALYVKAKDKDMVYELKTALGDLI